MSSCHAVSELPGFFVARARAHVSTQARAGTVRAGAVWRGERGARLLRRASGNRARGSALARRATCQASETPTPVAIHHGRRP
ncbi:hypothetical protein BRADI_1g11573v3 [Brachypodium distachyon]|uniref:Uncharacterized protein n=1 Tax=Brachypodium distachyon TaxID=15368 RepID=A0A2K2DJ12_BRADI|nr:hypothetical protein BRADI_1g11573v3 [Brachypodium distachyon]